MEEEGEEDGEREDEEERGGWKKRVRRMGRRRMKK